ncbi:MAG: adenosylcobinamide-GDP ribazoletransferase [Candidatus Nanopelagicales bacterium]|nr:adenosylcobinamide-GDP ribazoletransferase [Candidatus Nanopelagicales bacterium]
MLQALRLSVGMLTILPTAKTPGAAENRDTARRAMMLAPVVGVLIGLASAALLIVSRIALGFTGGDPELEPETSAPVALAASVIAVTVMQWMTGALRVSSLVDAAGATPRHQQSTESLPIARGPAAGAAGATVVMALVLVQLTTLAVSVSEGHGTLAVVTAAVAGRVAMVWVARRPPARGDELAGRVAGHVSTARAVAITAASLIVPIGLLALDDDPVRIFAVFAILAIPLAVLVTTIQADRWADRLGGTTQEILAASVEIGTTVALIAVALAA